MATTEQANQTTTLTLSLTENSKLKTQNSKLLLGLALAVYVLVVSLLHWVRLAHHMDGFDLAFYRQAIWNTGQGRFLAVSGTDFSSSLFGTDVILIYALMTPFYLLIPSPMTLLVLETLVVASGAIPIYWLARDRLKREGVAGGLAVAYLLLPALQNGNLYELRERMMGGAFLLFAFYWWQKGRLSLFVVAAGLALSCRPENGLVLIMLSLYAWLSGYWRKPGFGWRYVLTPALLGAVWFGAALLLIQAVSTGGYALGSTFAGGSPVAAVTTLLTNPVQGWQQLFPDAATLIGKLLYIPLLLLPFAFLPLLRPAVLLMALPPVGLNLLAAQSRGIQWNPFDYHYQAAVLPWLMVATIFAIEAMQDKPPRLTLLRQHTAWKLAGTVLGLALLLNLALNLLSLTSFAPTGWPPVKNGPARIIQSKSEPRWAVGETLLKQIPADAPLAISNTWAVEVPSRPGLWYLAVRPLYSRHPTQDAQYIFADLHNSEEAGLVKTALDSGQWQKLDQQSDYILLKRK